MRNTAELETREYFQEFLSLYLSYIRTWFNTKHHQNMLIIELHVNGSFIWTTIIKKIAVTVKQFRNCPIIDLSFVHTLSIPHGLNSERTNVTMYLQDHQPKFQPRHHQFLLVLQKWMKIKKILKARKVHEETMYWYVKLRYPELWSATTVYMMGEAKIRHYVTHIN